MAAGQGPAKALARGAMRMSKRLLCSYIFDWILIFGIAAVGGGFNLGVRNGNKRPFSLQDPSISYPLRPDTVTVTVLVIIAFFVPAVLTAIISFIFIPGPTASPSTPKALIWRRKLWEFNTAWMGLGLCLASTFTITEGLKDLAGKPRPYAIGVCNPDLTRINEFKVGGLGQNFDNTGATPILVSSGICQETDPAVLRQIFASWPSGHSSFSFAGLLYLSLFLCSKFTVGIPYLLPNTKGSDGNTYEYDGSLIHPARPGSSDSSSSSPTHNGIAHFNPPPRNSTAAPPIYLLLLAVFLPVGTAIFVSVSRWFDFHHHGLDILSGALLGAFCAWGSFRYYHMPVRRGSGWAWGARSRGRAFWVGVGRDGYVGDEGWASQKATRDVETGSRSAITADKGVTGVGDADRGDVPGLNGEQSGETGYTIRNGLVV